jgi:hypothetical protein
MQIRPCEPRDQKQDDVVSLGKRLERDDDGAGSGGAE